MASHGAASSPAAVPHFDDLEVTPQEQLLISQRTPLRFHTYAPADALPAAAARTLLEPYLPLGSPTPSSSSTSPLSLMLTPPRPEDSPALVSTLNDPRVTPQLVGPPYPYSDELARDFILLKRRETRALLQRLVERARRELQRAGEGVEAEQERREQGVSSEADEDAAPWLDELPLGVIRRADGEYVGDFGVSRWQYEDVVDAEERASLVRENEGKKAGDPSALWSFGFYLHPSYHGLGIMAHVLCRLLDVYFFSHLGLDEVRGSAFADNVASIRTQEKCGLRRYGGCEHEVSESRGGGVRSMVVLKVTRRDFERL
ncbi:hypothetical protein JCM9279_007435 [Rhodotorula babjevae]